MKRPLNRAVYAKKIFVSNDKSETAVAVIYGSNGEGLATTFSRTGKE
jgi:hypothetical protein